MNNIYVIVIGWLGVVIMFAVLVAGGSKGTDHDTPAR